MSEWLPTQPRAERPRRVIVLSFGYRAPRAVVDYVADLAGRGREVDLLTVDDRPWVDAGPLPGVRIHGLGGLERRHPVPRSERVLVHRLPRSLLSRARRLPGGAVLARLEEVHRRLARRFRRRVFLPCYGLLRPWTLLGLFRPHWSRLPLGGDVERIVAADPYAVTLAWRLARACPSAVVTTALVVPARQRDAVAEPAARQR